MRHLWLPFPLLLALLGCDQSLTFAHEGNVDFKAIRAVYVQPISIGGDGFDNYSLEAQHYLAEELREISGFERVETNPSAAVDAVLAVDLNVDEDRDYECNDDWGCDEDISYDVDARFTLRTPSGDTITEDEVSDEGNGRREAQEDALDEVAHFFLRPYRI